MTGELINRWHEGLAIDLDHSALVQCKRRFSEPGWGFIRADLTNYPLPERHQRYPLVGNLPYHVTGPALISMISSAHYLRSFQGMLQWEVAERLSADPGDSEFRGISLLFDRLGSIEVPFRIPASAFRPEPAVDSAWIEFTPDSDAEPDPKIQSFVRRCFRHPRKTLINNLADRTENKQRWRSWMNEQDWDSRRRPQSLTVNDLEVLYSAWMKHNELS